MSENYIWTNNTVVYNYFPTNVLGSYSPTGMHSVNALLSPTCSQLGFKPYEVLKQPPRRVAPICAFLCGLMQFSGGIISQTFCMIFLCSINDPINVIVRTMALGIISDVDGICFRNMSKENRIFLKWDSLKV